MEDNNKFWEQQIKLLHCRKIPNLVLINITKGGKLSYDYLLVGVSDDNLSDLQIINITNILFMMRHYDYFAFIEKTIELINSEKIAIRSHAAKALLTLIKIEEEFNQYGLFDRYPKKYLIFILQQAIKHSIFVPEQIQNYLNSNSI